MDEPTWLSRAVIEMIHDELVAEHGGVHGIRLGGDHLIESAIARPRQHHAYEPAADLPRLAAAYLFGLVRNHAFVDGNKRVAFGAAATFLLMNGCRLTAPEAEAYDLVMRSADGSVTEQEIALWIRDNVEQNAAGS